MAEMGSFSTVLRSATQDAVLFHPRLFCGVTRSPAVVEKGHCRGKAKGDIE